MDLKQTHAKVNALRARTIVFVCVNFYAISADTAAASASGARVRARDCSDNKACGAYAYVCTAHCRTVCAINYQTRALA